MILVGELENALRSADTIYVVEDDSNEVKELDVNLENTEYDRISMQYYFWYLDKSYKLVDCYLTKEEAEASILRKQNKE